MSEPWILRQLGRCRYDDIWRQMREFTEQRVASTANELWLLEHDPVFTLGQAGRPEHLLNPGAIPVVRSDRGGQVTYHGPGQLVVYVLLDLQRAGFSVRHLVMTLEEAVSLTLARFGIEAGTRAGAPGVYVGDAKIASLGLRVRRGCSYHGLALNVAMDLAPFSRINPCGHAGLRVTQLSDLGCNRSLGSVAGTLVGVLHGLLTSPPQVPNKANGKVSVIRMTGSLPMMIR